MSDILLKIRAAFDCDEVPQKNVTLRRAHDEIESLRKAMGDEGRQFMQALVDDACEEKKKRIAAEGRGKQLEAALRAMLTNYGPPDSVAPLCQYPDWHPIEQARRALAAATDQTGTALSSRNALDKERG